MMYDKCRGNWEHRQRDESDLLDCSHIHLYTDVHIGAHTQYIGMRKAADSKADGWIIWMID